MYVRDPNSSHGETIGYNRFNVAKLLYTNDVRCKSNPFIPLISVLRHWFIPSFQNINTEHRYTE